MQSYFFSDLISQPPPPSFSNNLSIFRVSLPLSMVICPIILQDLDKSGITSQTTTGISQETSETPLVAPTAQIETSSIRFPSFLPDVQTHTEQTSTEVTERQLTVGSTTASWQTVWSTTTSQSEETLTESMTQPAKPTPTTSSSTSSSALSIFTPQREAPETTERTGMPTSWTGLATSEATTHTHDEPLRECLVKQYADELPVL